jgi:hypothetical protein
LHSEGIDGHLAALLVNDLYRPAVGTFKELRLFCTNFSNNLSDFSCAILLLYFYALVIGQCRATAQEVKVTTSHRAVNRPALCLNVNVNVNLKS